MLFEVQPGVEPLGRIDGRRDERQVLRLLALHPGFLRVALQGLRHLFLPEAGIEVILWIGPVSGEQAKATAVAGQQLEHARKGEHGRMGLTEHEPVRDLHEPVRIARRAIALDQHVGRLAASIERRAQQHQRNERKRPVLHVQILPVPGEDAAHAVCHDHDALAAQVFHGVFLQLLRRERKVLTPVVREIVRRPAAHRRFEQLHARPVDLLLRAEYRDTPDAPARVEVQKDPDLVRATVSHERVRLDGVHAVGEARKFEPGAHEARDEEDFVAVVDLAELLPKGIVVHGLGIGPAPDLGGTRLGQRQAGDGPDEQQCGRDQRGAADAIGVSGHRDIRQECSDRILAETAEETKAALTSCSSP